MSGLARYGTDKAIQPSFVEGKAPPYDLDAEGACLSAIMIDPKAMKVCASLLTHEHFYSEAHRRIYDAATKVAASGTTIDIVAIANQLKTEGRLEQVSGFGYLTDLLNASPDVTNVRKHAEIVFEMWRRREAILICQHVEADLYNSAIGADAFQGFMAKASRDMSQLTARDPRSAGESALDVLKRILQSGALAAKRAADGDAMIVGATTTLDALDEMCGGMLPGKKFTIAAWPGCGKSVLGLQIARMNAANGVGAAVFATEQTNDELAVRLLAATSSIDSKRVMRFVHHPTLSNEEWGRITEAAKVTAPIPLALEADHQLSVDDIIAKTQTMVASFPARFGCPLGIVVVDYLQRLAPPKHFPPGTNKAVINDYCSRALKTMAQDLGIVVVELAQQSMTKDKNGKAVKPSPGMIDWSRGCERESDGVVYIWERGENDFVGVVTKVREGGMAGEFPIDFQKPFSRMVA